MSYLFKKRFVHSAGAETPLQDGLSRRLRQGRPHNRSGLHRSGRSARREADRYNGRSGAEDVLTASVSG